MVLLRDALVSRIDSVLVDQLIQHYYELKKRFFLRRYEPTELSCGMFVEIIMRILEYLSRKSYTPIGTTVDLGLLSQELEQKYKGILDDSLRIHIPRTLRAVYDVRSRRGAAHVANISPNLMDSTYVVAACDWIVAELVRLCHGLPPEKAQELVDTVVERRAPVVEHFGDSPLVLDPTCSLPEEILALLYSKSAAHIQSEELSQWIPNAKQDTVELALQLLVSLRLVHQETGFRITARGSTLVEKAQPTDIGLMVASLQEYARIKGINTHDDAVHAIAQWFCHKTNQPDLDSDTVAQCYPIGGLKRPVNPGQHLSNNANKRFLERTAAGRYRLTPLGFLTMKNRYAFVR